MSDIQVLCGSQAVDIQILLCPIYFNGYNETLLSLNSVHSKEQCKGTPDFTADPPVLKFNFSITEEGISTCSSNMVVSSLNLKYFLSCSSYLFLLFQVTDATGTGVFADFSTVQYITVSGTICSKDPGAGSVTYHQEMMYKFSCHYPLQYLVNNTQMSV